MLIQIDLERYPALRAELDARPPREFFSEDTDPMLGCDLDRYYNVLRDELAQLRFSFGEAALIIEANMATHVETRHYQLAWMSVEDGIRYDNLGEKWGLDAEQAQMLVKRLYSLSPGASMALIDAIERFWNSDVQADLATKLREAGLLR